MQAAHIPLQLLLYLPRRTCCTSSTGRPPDASVSEHAHQGIKKFNKSSNFKDAPAHIARRLNTSRAMLQLQRGESYTVIKYNAQQQSSVSVRVAPGLRCVQALTMLKHMLPYQPPAPKPIPKTHRGGQQWEQQLVSVGGALLRPIAPKNSSMVPPVTLLAAYKKWFVGTALRWSCLRHSSVQCYVQFRAPAAVTRNMGRFKGCYMLQVAPKRLHTAPGSSSRCIEQTEAA